jgi:hypothetical protein
MVGNNPVVYVDPFGKKKVTAKRKVTFVVAVVALGIGGPIGQAMGITLAMDEGGSLLNDMSEENEKEMRFLLLQMSIKMLLWMNCNSNQEDQVNQKNIKENLFPPGYLKGWG